MSTFFQKLFGNNRDSNNRDSQKNTSRTRRLGMEPLECREMLSVSPLTSVHSPYDDHALTTHDCVACTSLPLEMPAANNNLAAVAPFDLADTFKLNSKPDSLLRIYLDFNGFVSNLNWGEAAENGTAERGWSLDNNFGEFSDRELTEIQWIWQIISERFSSFDVNVTTDLIYDEPGTTLLTRQVNDVDGWGIRAVFGADGPWGGVAYLTSFNWDVDIPCYVQNYGAFSAATVAGHEIGHTLGLYHDGRELTDKDGKAEHEEYYGGHPVYDGRTDTTAWWAPVMGVGYGAMEQFSKGEYDDANNQQDDLAVMSTYIPYRPDVGLTFVNDGNQQVANGIIETSGDVDSIIITVETVGRYSFEAISGVNINGTQISSLYYVLTLKNNITGATVFEKYSPLDTFQVSFEGELAAGTYTLSIAGAGVEPAGTWQGFSNYGSIGAYEISVVGVEIPVAPTNFRSTNRTTSSATFAWNSMKYATSYDIRYRPAGTSTWTEVTDFTGTTGTVTKLADDTEYEFQIRAVNKNGKSSWTPTPPLTVTTIAIPVTPANFRCTERDIDSVTLEWNSGKAPTYEIRYRKADASTWTGSVTTTALTRTISGLEHDVLYAFQIRSINGRDRTDWSATLFAIPCDAPFGYNCDDWRKVNVTELDYDDADHVKWTFFEGELRLAGIDATDSGVTGILDLSGCEMLEFLRIDANQLKELNVADCTSLRELYCVNNQLTKLDVSGCVELKILDIYSNKLQSLDIADCVALQTLYCHHNQLETLNVSNNAALQALSVIDNQLTVLNVSNNAALTVLGVASNRLTALDVSNNMALQTLWCGYNRLKTLDVSNNTALRTLGCQSNELTTLDVSNNTALEYLYCDGNPMDEQDFAKAMAFILREKSTYYVDGPNAGELIAGQVSRWEFSATETPSPIRDWSISWGDGTKTVINGGPRSRISDAHFYRQAGDYTIIIQTTDFDGIVSTATFDVVVAQGAQAVAPIASRPNMIFDTEILETAAAVAVEIPREPAASVNFRSEVTETMRLRQMLDLDGRDALQKSAGVAFTDFLWSDGDLFGDEWFDFSAEEKETDFWSGVFEEELLALN